MAAFFVELCTTYFVLLHLRQSGIGSLPSAITTACSARDGLLNGASGFAIAQYIPANATAVSRISTFLFMGEFSKAQISRRAKYSPGRALWAAMTCG